MSMDTIDKCLVNKIISMQINEVDVIYFKAIQKSFFRIFFI